MTLTTRPNLPPCLLIFLSGQEEAMMRQLVENGPLAAIVDAISWQDYLGGIIQHHCSSHSANHAVLIIGYDTTGTCCGNTCLRRNYSSRKEREFIFYLNTC